MPNCEIADLKMLLGSAITAFSTLMAVLLTARYSLKLSRINTESQNKQKNRELKISKIEEFYLLFEKWEVNFSSIYLCHLRCYLNKLSYQAVMEITGKSEVLLPGEAQKLVMLLNIHFPELVEDYQLVNNARKKIVPYLNDPKETKLSPTEFTVEQEKFEKVCAEFKFKISSLAQSI